MRHAALLTALLLGLCIWSPLVLGGFETFRVIDDFEVDTNALTVLNPLAGRSATKSTSTIVPAVLGGERDLILVTESGPAGASLSSWVAEGVWGSSSPGQAAGFSTLQYDGPEGSDTISHDGLGCFDLTVDGRADGFLLQARATFETDFKFFVYGFNGGSASVRKQVTSNENTYYYIEFATFAGQVDFTCVGAIAITATIPSHSEFFVDTLVLGTYTPDAASQSRSPTPTHSVTSQPSTSPTHSPLISSYLAGPSQSPSPSPTPANVPSIEYYECERDSDCAGSTSCTTMVCQGHTCVAQLAAQDGCCQSARDCPEHYCEEAACTANTCTYVPIACIDSNSHEKSPASPASPDDNGHGKKDDGGSNGWTIAGGVFGAVGLLLLLAVISLVVAVLIKRRRDASRNSTSVYDAMIGDM